MMNRSLALVPAAGLLLTSLAWAADKDNNKAPEGFVPLFNGKDLSGRKIPDGDVGHWKVVERVID